MSNQQTKWTSKQVFTTREAAELCTVSRQTIIRCFDRGELRGFRVPGSRFRRIPRPNLIRFMKARGIPTTELEGSQLRFLVMPGAGPFATPLVEHLRRENRYEVRVADTEYEAGKLCEQLRPHLARACSLENLRYLDSYFGLRLS